MAADPATANALGTHARIIKKLADQNQQLIGRLQMLEGQVQESLSRPRSPTETIDAIPGRRIESIMSGEIEFDMTLNGQVGPPITIQISQDGPFVATHYPMVLWRPSAPSTATNLNRWRPVSSWPMPTQQFTTDFVDLQYQIVDGGAQRNFQNNPRGPIFSRPDVLTPLPMPTLWAPNSVIQFIPTYQLIDWTGDEVETTEGTLHVDFPGYRIVNL